MRKLLTIVAALLAAAASASPALAADTVFVMRHLQKGDGADPSLSAEGAANAKAVAGMLERSGIKAIFATPTRRAIETAQPLAAKLGIAITPYDPRNPDALAKTVGAMPGAVLVVGHSNTVPDLVARFGGKQAVTLTEQDYGTVFVVTPGQGTLSEIKIEPTR
ncbi:MAG TPA: phosphoglycerate mutase family protein [Sphingomicrobium sp.]|jgi:broad specificity phosphatase PhoE|nr:phosphoglycerate mutase family protein [Sphingomicrobium sp.]